ncbi:MAG TPA: hypothetical protein ENJ53_02620 [Phaeodactylibacter sp.]|nr:hypothetical protein [Phaeodactylibacter sp.]
MYLFSMKSFFRIGLVFIFSWIALSSSAQLQVAASRPDANYEAGEMMYFEITSPTWGPVDYVIRYDVKMPPLASGTVVVNPNTPTKIPFVMEEPGSVLCSVSKNGEFATGGAIFSRFDLEPIEEEPADFDNFWNGVKAELAAVPMNPVLTFYDSTSLSETYRINLGNINNRRVYGFLSIPKGIPPPYPAILTLPPFGNAANNAPPQPIISEWGGAISLSISIHNSEPDVVDPNSYLPNNIADRDGIYYKQAITGAIRAIDYIFSRSDFNGTDLGVAGISQGGGLALMTAGIDHRVKSLAQTVSALCGHSGHRYDRAAGLPLYILDSRGTYGNISHEDSTLVASKYYDGIYFAKRFHGPALSFISYADTISPASTILTAINQLDEKGIIMHSIRLGHDNPMGFWDMRFEFWRKTFPAMDTNPFPWTLHTTGYDADAGNDIFISTNGTANLSATVTYNGAPLNGLSAKWMVVDGPGKVSFSSPTSYSTNATFSQSGTYTLRFVATDTPNLNTEWEFFTIYDFVKVTVN